MGGCFSSSSSSSSREIDKYYYVYPNSWVDKNYAKEFCLQEAMYSSLNASEVDNNNYHHPRAHNDSPTLIQRQEPEVKTKIERFKQQEPEIKPAESSGRFCRICLEEKPCSEIFRGTTTCTHLYCTECTIRYLETKIGENLARIKCPDVDCTRELELHTCRDLITKGMLERWHNNLCESLIYSWDRLYCPFQGCSAMMIVDDDEGDNARVTETECPTCHRLFCAQCKVPWHAGIGCEEFQRGGNPKKNSDDMVIEMAKSKQWRRCPRCRFYVEKSYGCLHIECRCGCKFCYGCGSVFSFLRPSLLHVCPKPDNTKS